MDLLLVDGQLPDWPMPTHGGNYARIYKQSSPSAYRCAGGSRALAAYVDDDDGTWYCSRRRSVLPGCGLMSVSLLVHVPSTHMDRYQLDVQRRIVDFHLLRQGGRGRTVLYHHLLPLSS